MAAHHRLTVLLLLLCRCSTAEPRQGLRPITLAGCPDKCGDVSIPFPLGTKPGCFLPGFQVYCNTSFTPPRAFLAYNDTGPLQEEGYMLNGRGPHLNYSMVPVELMDVSAGSSEARAYGAVTSLCYTSLNSSIMKLQSTALAEAGPFLLSAARNILVGVGWNVEAAIGESLIFPFDAYKISCSGLGYCNASLSGATQLRWFGARIITSPDDGYNGRWKANPCSYSMLVERSRYNFSTDDTSGYEVLPRRYPRGVPFVIDFAIRDATGSSCPRDGQPPPPGFACVSGNSSCANAATGKGYVCRCWEHYDGNPYITDGCLDINECEHPDLYPCSPHGVCRNKLGGYDCPCKPGMKGDGKNGTCTDIFPLAAKVVLSSGIAVFSMVVAFLLVLVRLQKTRLKELLKTRLKNVNCAVYTKDEIKKYTRDFSILLGNGKFGQVYKGTLPHDPQEQEGTPADDTQEEEGTTVAVKRSIKVTKETVEKFAEEVKIQAQMIHNNVLKLLGYCLDVDGPMLVYEFADNKDLEVLLHGKDSRELPLELRLDIAIGAAEGLKYMHGNAAKHIRHGDVKPDNILLHGKLKVVPKISDFGLSRLLTNPADGDLTKDVIGALGYIDPVFIRTNKQSLKNDVYSFGVVLLELITRKKVESVQNPRLITDFREVCQKEGSGGSTMFDKDFDMKSEEDISILEEIGKLALECLEDDCGDRPDMKEVAHRLETLKRKRWRQRGQDATSPQDYVKNNVDDFPSDADVPGASNYATSSLPLLPKRK